MLGAGGGVASLDAKETDLRTIGEDESGRLLEAADEMLAHHSSGIGCEEDL
jgi:hypothetical protein